MSWAQENKFLTGLIAVTVVGAGALGFLTWSAMSKYEAASDALEKTASEKKRLETLPVYPNAENLKKLQEQKEEHLVRIQELQKRMKTMELPEESLTPQGFQDRLRVAVTAYSKTAADNHMKLPEKFYMGFGEYQTKTPDDKTTPKLARQLRAIEQVLGYVTQYRAIELKKIFRQPLPEEGGPAPKVAPPKAGAKKVEPSAPLVTKQPFEIAFVGEQGTLQAVLNAIATTKSPFYIVRNITIQNTQPKPPSREPAPGSGAETAPAAPAAPAPTPEATAPAAPAPEAAPAPQTEALKFIVGEEKVEAQLQIEIVEFAEPPQKQTKGKKK